MPFRCPSFFLLILTSFLFVSNNTKAQSPVKQPPPNSKVQEKEWADLSGQLVKELSQAKADPKAGIRLADKLLELSYKTPQGQAKQYTILTKTADWATRAGDYGLAFSAIEEMNSYFIINATQRKVEVLEQIPTTGLKEFDYTTLVDLAQELVNKSMQADTYTLAKKANSLAESFAKKAKQLPTVLAVQRERQNILSAEKRFQEFQPFFVKLEKNPLDDQANQKKGLYLGLFKGQWKNGLFYLAQGTDKTLRMLAQRDLTSPKDPAEQRKLADSWLKVAQKYDGQIQVHLQQRAVFWYEQMIHTTQGEDYKQLETLIAKVPASNYRATVPWDFFGKPGQIRLFGRHNGNVYGVDFSPNGKKVLSGSTSRDASIWDTKSGKQLQRLQLQRSLIWGVAFGGKGKYAFTAGWDGYVKMYDVRTGKFMRDFKNPNFIDFNGIDVSSDGRTLITGSDDGAVRLWDVNTGKIKKTMNGHRGVVYGIQISKNGRFALSGGGSDRTLIYWDLKTGKVRQKFTGYQGQVRNVALSPDGRKAIASGEQQVRIWDLRTGKVLRRLQGHVGQVYAVAYSPDGRRIATGATDGTIRLWDANTGKEIHRFNGTGGIVYCLTFSPGGGRIVTGSSDNTVRMWGLPR